MELDPRERVRSLVLALPDAEVLEPAGAHLKLLVRGKRFGWYMENHHGDGRLCLECKAPPGASQEWVAKDSARYYIPSYGGSRGWIGVWLDSESIEWHEVAEILETAYEMTRHTGRPRRKS